MNKVFVFACLIAVACAPAKKESVALDSTQDALDTVSISPTPDVPAESTSAEPSTIYPELLTASFTDDVREAAVVVPLLALLKQYDSDKYSALTSNYSFGYKEEVGPDDTEDVIETQTRTWYFDSLLSLKCYIQNYEFRGTNGGHPPSKKIIYLFSNDSLVAAYADQVGVYETAKVSTRAIAAQCPKCGAVFTERRDVGVDTKSYYELSELEPAGWAKLSDTFFDEYREIAQWLKKSKRPAGDDYYTFTREQGTGDKAYSEEFTIGTDVYNKIVAKK